MTRDPDKWSQEDWKKHDAALNRICSAKADAFARDLNTCGWKIVPADGYGGKWPMNGPGPAPSWADPYEAPKRPALQAVKDTE